MSVHVTTQLKTRAEHTEEVITALREALPHSLQHEAARPSTSGKTKTTPRTLSRSPRWATRQNYEDYLAWRTETGMTDEIDELLTEPLSIQCFDDIVSLTREQ